MKLPITIDQQNGIPVYIQLGEQIRMLIRKGVLVSGDLMPTTRSLAVDLGINANTVVRVYRELQDAGQLRLKRGVGTFVAEDAHSPMAKKDWKILENKVSELITLCRQTGISSVELAQFINTRWKEIDNV